MACDAPTRLAVTWTYGEPTGASPDEVEVRLTAEGDATILELEHRSESGASWAGGVGAGWESGLIMFDFLFRGDDPRRVLVEKQSSLTRQLSCRSRD